MFVRKLLDSHLSLIFVAGSFSGLLALYRLFFKKWLFISVSCFQCKLLSGSLVLLHHGSWLCWARLILSLPDEHFINSRLLGRLLGPFKGFLLRSYWPLLKATPFSSYAWPVIGLNSSASFWSDQSQRRGDDDELQALVGSFPTAKLFLYKSLCVTDCIFCKRV